MGSVPTEGSVLLRAGLNSRCLRGDFPHDDKGSVKETILRRVGLLFHGIQTTRTMAPFNAAPLKSALFSFQIRHIAFLVCARLNLTVENTMFYACSVNNWASDLHLILEKMPFNAGVPKKVCASNAFNLNVVLKSHECNFESDFFHYLYELSD